MSQKIQEFFGRIKKKLIYNPIIRYTMLNCLKLNYTAVVALIGVESTRWTNTVVAILTISVILSLPFIYARVLYKIGFNLTDLSN